MPHTIKAFKKHISTSPSQMYERRGWIGRKVRMWMNGLMKVSPPLTRYRATKRLNKRVTS